MKVIAELTGGFGNQLFAYACGYALAKKKGADLYINTYMADNGMSIPIRSMVSIRSSMSRAVFPCPVDILPACPEL